MWSGLRSNFVMVGTEKIDKIVEIRGILGDSKRGICLVPRENQNARKYLIEQIKERDLFGHNVRFRIVGGNPVDSGSHKPRYKEIEGSLFQDSIGNLFVGGERLQNFLNGYWSCQCFISVRSLGTPQLPLIAVDQLDF
jgi:hypothetical protein